ncbi:MAG TPA: hypothetical protein VLD37_03950 [Candidatus Bilamarchaeum sp.]|nr:hypothetical protein [Candidatus Bilamarchaeum sp.]
MTNVLVSQPVSEEKRPKAPFAGRAMLENLQAKGPLDKLRESLASCSCEGFDLAGFASSLSSVKGTRISGGPAMVLGSDSGSFLLFREPYEGFNLIVSGLLGLGPQDAKVLKKEKGESMFLVAVPPGKAAALESGLI